MASKIYWFNLYHTFLLPFLIAIQIIFKVKPKHFDRQGNNLLNAIFVSAWSYEHIWSHLIGFVTVKEGKESSLGEANWSVKVEQTNWPSTVETSQVPPLLSSWTVCAWEAVCDTRTRQLTGHSYFSQQSLFPWGFCKIKVWIITALSR